VLKHNDASESGFYDYAISMRQAGSQGVWNGCWPGPVLLFLENLANNLHTELPTTPAKQRFSSDYQSAHPVIRLDQAIAPSHERMAHQRRTSDHEKTYDAGPSRLPTSM
jgi:hypothetical protein